jgi:8-oxo-dGTP pyrophosphatase MutT (NUDIX family)
MQTTPPPTDVAAARPSSTVVLVRQGEMRPEILMVRRNAAASFGSAYAFPGGVLEPSDGLVHHLCAGRSPGQASRLLSVPQAALDFYSAAVRELFEETGVLLASTTLSAAERVCARQRLNVGVLSWDRFAADHLDAIDCGQLHYFSFRVTPQALPKRYATRFFLAALPQGQVALHDGAELTDSRWMAACDVLEASREQRMRVHYPTRKTLERLAPFDTVAAMCDWAESCGAAGVPRITRRNVPESGQ